MTRVLLEIAGYLFEKVKVEFDQAKTSDYHALREQARQQAASLIKGKAPNASDGTVDAIVQARLISRSEQDFMELVKSLGARLEVLDRVVARVHSDLAVLLRDRGLQMVVDSYKDFIREMYEQIIVDEEIEKMEVIPVGLLRSINASIGAKEYEDHIYWYSTLDKVRGDLIDFGLRKIQNPTLKYRRV